MDLFKPRYRSVVKYRNLTSSGLLRIPSFNKWQHKENVSIVLDKDIL